MDGNDGQITGASPGDDRAATMPAVARSEPGSPPHPLLGPGLISLQVQFVSAGVKTRLRVDIHEGWLALTGVSMPRRWRRAAQVGALIAGGVIGYSLAYVRPWWSPELFATMFGALLLFLVVAVLAGRPSRIVTLIVPVSQVGVAGPGSLGDLSAVKRKTVTLVGPFADEWSTDGTVKLACGSVDDARALIEALHRGPPI